MHTYHPQRYPTYDSEGLLKTVYGAFNKPINVKGGEAKSANQGRKLKSKGRPGSAQTRGGSKMKLFGTDGIRGKANVFPMTVEVALSLGRAVGKVFIDSDNMHPRVVIGKDTRLSCYMFENALIAGLCSMGVNTLMVGPLPTPGISFITRAYRADAGIMISASHNSFTDNGIKFFSSNGFKLSDITEKLIERFVHENEFSTDLPTPDKIGKNTKIDYASGRYIEFAKATFPRKLSLKGLKIVLDCANGAGYYVAPLIFKELDADLQVYCVEPNGLNINLNCGSLPPQIVQKGVIDSSADVGVALDGDADRLILVDENAQIVDGDVILAICAKDMLKKGELKGNKVVTTIMSNCGVVSYLESLGIEVFRAPVGDRYVIQEMLRQGVNLGGEQSGHMIFLDHNTTGDGLVSALQVLKIMIETDSKLSELAAEVGHFPQALVNVKVKSKPNIDDFTELKKGIQLIENDLEDKGRVLVRYSGTEMLCRIMIECEKQKEAFQYANRLADVVRTEIGVA